MKMCGITEVLLQAENAKEERNVSRYMDGIVERRFNPILSLNLASKVFKLVESIIVGVAPDMFVKRNGV